MVDSTDDLSALRIEREPLRPNAGRWVKWLVLLIVAAGAGAGGWLWLNRERPIEVEVSCRHRESGRYAGVGSQCLRLRHRAATRDGVVEGDGQAGRSQRRRGNGRPRGAGSRAAGRPTLRASLALAEAQLAASRRSVPETEVRLNEARTTLAAGSSCARRALPRLRRWTRRRRKSIRCRPGWNRRASRSTSLRARSRCSSAALDDMVIRAPFSGVAISKDAQPGEMVSPVSAGGGFTRTGICTIVDMKSLEIEVDVNESYINRVTAGTAGHRGARRLSRLVDPGEGDHHGADGRPAESDRARPHRLRRARSAHSARHGDQGDVSARRRCRPRRRCAQPVTLVPKAPCERENGSSYVFVVRDNTVERRAVQMGGSDGDRLEVRAGLKGGDRVVVSPPAELAEGAEMIVGIQRASGGTQSEFMSALVRVKGIHKYFTRGSERIDVLKGVESRDSAGRLPRVDGAVGVREDHAAQPDGRARQAVGRIDRGRWDRHRRRCPAVSCRAGARITSGSSFSSTTCCRSSPPSATSICRCC